MNRRVPPALLAALLLVSVLPGALASAAPLPAPAATPAVPAAVVTPYASVLREPIAPGVIHDRGGWATSSGGQAVHLVEVDLDDPAIHLEAALSNGRATGLETVRGQADRVSRDGRRVVAAVNGDVWSGYSSDVLHAPNGVHVQGGELMSATTAPRPAFGVLADGSPLMGTVAVTTTITLPDGLTVVAADRVNKSRRSGETILFTPRWGASTLTDAGGVEVVLTGATLPLTPAGTWSATVAAVRPSLGNTSLPVGTLVLSADGVDEAVLRTLTPGATLTVTTGITAGFEGAAHLVGAREWIVRDGVGTIEPRPSSADQAHPRSAVGITAEGDLVLATVDGRQGDYSAGVTLPDLAALMLERGAVQALNLDGGGSTTLLVRQPGDVEASVANRPSDGRERAVTNSILVVSAVPTGALATVRVRPDDPTLVVGTQRTFVARAHDAAYNGVPVAKETVAWTSSGDAGAIDAAGRFSATSVGAAAVAGTVSGIAGEVAVTVVPDTVAPDAAPPAARLRSGSIVGASTASFTVAWDAATDIGSGVASYQLRRSVDGGAWEAVALPGATTRSLRVSLRHGHHYRFSVRATDRAGNTGTWVNGPTFRVRSIAESAGAVRWSKGWTTSTWSGYLGSRGRHARTAGAWARFTFTGREVGWIAPYGPTRGSARIYVDGAYVTTVSLRRSSVSTRRVAWGRAWPASGRHTVEIRVVGTRGHPRVDVDGFVLVDPPAADPVLVGAGDIASCAMSGDSATAKLLDGIAGTVFTAGDNAYEHGSSAQFSDCYAPTWGRHKARTRPAPGNHDYATSGAAGYFGYFGSRAGTPGEGWYAYDLGAWRVYALNSNCAAIGGCDEGSAQEQWLRADLAANPRTCVAAIWHHPIFTSGVHGNDPTMIPIWEALAEAGADVVINGHDHDYERFAPQLSDGTPSPDGMREFVVGTGGAGIRAFGTIRANSEVRSTSAHGVLKLTLRATSYSWSFVPVAGKTFKDTGSAACR